MQKKGKGSEIPTMEEQLANITELAEIAKLTCFIREKTSTCTDDWKLFVDFLLKMEKIELAIYASDDYKV